MHNLLMQFFTLESSKVEVFKTPFFFHIMITYNDHPRHGKHVLCCICVFFHIIWVLGARGGGGGANKGLLHNLSMQFFTVGSLKIEVLELYFLIP